MEDKLELKVIALKSAIDLALSVQNVSQAKAEDIVKEAGTMFDFLIEGQS